MTPTNCVPILNALVKEKKKLLLTIYVTILIWKTRNLLKHQNKTLTNGIIIKKINTKLGEIIRVNFQKHIRQETTETFKKIFAQTTLYVRL